MSQASLRDEVLDTLQHVRDATGRVMSCLGKGGKLTFPDSHKISEGLFLSAWTHWEQFLRSLLIEELASSPSGALRSEVRTFRTKGAPWRLAERILGHPDEEKWIDWSDYRQVLARAEALLGAGNRFDTAKIVQGDLEKLKRIRNAVAHKSDRAWKSFVSLTTSPPFSLKPNQRKGLTVGRFLSAHNWGNDRVLVHSVDILADNARKLVP